MSEKEETPAILATTAIATTEAEDSTATATEAKATATAATITTATENSSNGTKRTAETVTATVKDPEEQAPADDDSRPKREKRARKSADVFVPQDFSAVDKTVAVPLGRGTKLDELDDCKASIESFPNTSFELQSAFRLLYGRKAIKKDLKAIKSTLLEFCGFLLEQPAEINKDEKEAQDEQEETKFSTRAFKLTLPEIKKLCDLFVVDRTKKNNKDDLIDALLDFLGAPSAELLKGSHNKSSSKGSKGKAGGSSKKEEEADEESDDEVESEEEDVAEDALQKDGLPTDKALRKWVRAYVSSFNLKKVTLKHAIATASDKFGVDLTPKKSLLKTILKNEM